MSTLSLCMIVRDEEYFLADCLSAARPHVDEIVVVDTGSVDASRDIASEWADIQAEFEWVDDFSAARNFSLDLATGDWILVLDADERLSPVDYPRLREAMENRDFDGVSFFERHYSHEPGVYRVAADPADPMTRGYPWYSQYAVLRMFRSDPKIRFRSPIHEEVYSSIPENRIMELDIALHHYLHESPTHPRKERVLRYLEMMDRELEVNPDGRLYSIAGASALHTAKDYDKAANYLLRAAEHGFQRNRSLEGAAEASYLGGRHEQARRIYAEAYTRGHSSASMCVNMANLAVRAGEHSAALGFLEECLALGGLGEAKDKILRGNIEALRRALSEAE